jgi:hypothetical protein
LSYFHQVGYPLQPKAGAVVYLPFKQDLSSLGLPDIANVCFFNTFPYLRKQAGIIFNGC